MGPRIVLPVCVVDWEMKWTRHNPTYVEKHADDITIIMLSVKVAISKVN